MTGLGFLAWILDDMVQLLSFSPASVILTVASLDIFEATSR
jgi:hypothetical protein